MWSHSLSTSRSSLLSASTRSSSSCTSDGWGSVSLFLRDAFRAASLIHSTAWDCGEDTTTPREARDDSCQSSFYERSLAYSSRSTTESRTTFIRESSLDDFGGGSTMQSSLSSDSRYRRQRPVAIAIGWDDLQYEEARKVVIVPSTRKSWSSYSSQPGLSLTSTESFDTPYYQIHSPQIHHGIRASRSELWSVGNSHFSSQGHVKRKPRRLKQEQRSYRAKSYDDYSTYRGSPPSYSTHFTHGNGHFVE